MIRIPVLKQIETIVEDLSKCGEEIPSTAALGIQAWQSLLHQMGNYARSNGYSDANPQYMQEVTFMTALRRML